VSLDELVAAQVNLTFEVIPRPVPYSVSNEFTIPLLRYTAVLPLVGFGENFLKRDIILGLFK
jgi:hypothetical protein